MAQTRAHMQYGLYICIQFFFFLRGWLPLTRIQSQINYFSVQGRGGEGGDKDLSTLVYVVCVCTVQPAQWTQVNLSESFFKLHFLFEVGKGQLVDDTINTRGQLHRIDTASVII